MSTKSIIVGSGPGTRLLPIGVITDGQLVRRNGDSIEGIDASSVTSGVATYANGVRETGGPTTLTMGAIADGEYVARSGTTIVGQSATAVGNAVASQVGSVLSAITSLTPTDATVAWTTQQNIGLTRTAGSTTLTLPSAADVTDWPPGSRPRWVYKLNVSVQTCILAVDGTCKINGDALGTDMTIPGFTVQFDAATLGAKALVYRGSATEYFVF